MLAGCDGSCVVIGWHLRAYVRRPRKWDRRGAVNDVVYIRDNLRVLNLRLAIYDFDRPLHRQIVLAIRRYAFPCLHGRRHYATLCLPAT